MNIDLKLGNCLEELDKIEKNSIDSIVTDPPYELNFMGKGWDNAGVSFNKETWKKCYEVLKPGGYMLAFGGTRTYHRIACAIEDAGFEIRDCIMWLYGSGFPKSMNIGLAIDKKNGIESKIIGKAIKGSSPLPNNHKGTWADNQKNGEYEIKEAQNQWNGWGTTLKPAYEPIIVARKPFKGSLIDNVLENGVGGLNIDECRVETKGKDLEKLNSEWDREWNTNYNNFAKKIGGSSGFDYSNSRVKDKELTGRFPSNVILTYDETDFNEVCGGMPYTKFNGGKTTMSDFSKYNGSMMNTSNLKDKPNRIDSDYIAPNDSGSASRYFYCAKASKKDRDEGLDEFEEYILNDDVEENIKNDIKRLLNL